VSSVEEADVVIVGARIAGCAAAIPLARANRKVIMIDRARFPSNTVSTHGLFSSHVAELDALGALDRVLAEKPRVTQRFHFHMGDVHLSEALPANRGFDYGFVLDRPALDLALLETARAAGVDVREGCMAVGVEKTGARVTGVRFRSDGDEREKLVRARLTIGADGRNSRIAEYCGVGRPYRTSANRRGFVWRYMSDPQASAPSEWVLSRGRTITMVGSMPDGLMIVVAMPPVEDIALWRADEDAAWRALRAEHPVTAERIAGAEIPIDALRQRRLPAKLLTCSKLTAFFRASTGPGWALAGDAGQFKDPTIAQGIRDGLRHGRQLGEAAAETLDGRWDLDRALAGWELERDRDSVACYHWANRESRYVPELDRVFAKVLESYQSPRAEGRLADAFCRNRRPEEVVGPRLAAKCLLCALAEPGVARRRLLAVAAHEAKAELDIRLERWSGTFRYPGPTATERPLEVSA
jgi:2-polyprenyl-6-methoxyphenol hydroxylase-like FAD-dependent oxidoreductase